MANLDTFDQNVEFVFGENNNYQKVGNADLQYELTVKKDEVNQADRIGLMVTLTNWLRMPSHFV